MIKQSFIRLVAFFLFIGVAICSNAQETTSDIVGKVTDNGKAVAGATVTATHLPTGTKYVTSSRKDGRFNIPNAKIGGPYTITTTFVGFKTEQQENIYLALGQEYKADFSLQNESAALTEVVVKTNRQDKVFNNSRTGSQEVITRTQIERLPTINRSLQDFTKLTPVANGLAFGGQSNQYNNVTVDGANFNNSFGLSGTLGGQTNSQPISLDAIEQIQVNVTPFDVRQGGFSGAGINTVTRSGTNTFKGTVYDYTKGASNQGYNVRGVTIPKQDFNYNLVGGSVGGPIIKNKLFFFVSGEAETRKDPATSFVAADATHTPDGVSVSAANKSTLDSLSTFLGTQFGYNPGPYQGYSYPTQSKKLTAKIDWNIDGNNTFTLKYNLLNSSREIQASNSGSVSGIGRTPGATALPFYGSGYKIYNNFNIVLGELNTRFGNKAVNKLQIGYTALRDYRQALTSSPFPLVDILDGNGNPFTSFGYEQYTYGNKLNTDVIQVNDVFTYYAGSHEITLGTQNSFKKYQNGFSPAYEGVYRFNNIADFYASVAGTKAAARYDLSAALTTDGSFPLVGPKDAEYGFFAQDKYRVTKNLTVTYGARFDVAAFKNTFYYNPVVDTLSNFYNGTHLNTGQAPKTSVQISPRVGFNWDVFGDKKTQIRGGIGLFQGPPPFVWISNQASNSGVALFGSVSNGKNYVFSPDVNKYRDSATTGNSYSINVTDPNFKFPQALKSSFAIDQKLPNNYIITFEYTIAKDVNAAFFQNLNLPSTGVAINNGGDGRTRYTGTQIYSKGVAGNPNIGNAIYMTNVNGGYAYTATVQVQKTFKNLYLNAAYTYSEAKDVMVGGSTAATMWGSKAVTGSPNTPVVGYSNAYLPHRFIASSSYKFTYSKIASTSVGAYFEAAPAGVGSYVYSGDLNNDGNTSNDLMYIPTTTDIANYVNNKQLEASAASSVTTYVNGVASTTKVADTRTTAQIAEQLNHFILQSKYLSGHRGQYAKRNEVVFPWFSTLNVNVTQDFQLKTGKGSHTLRLSLDIVNFGNLLNHNWGIFRTPTTLSPLKFDKMAADGVTPIFSMPYQFGGTQTPYKDAFKDDTSIGSRWQMQFGVRYLFN